MIVKLIADEQSVVNRFIYWIDGEFNSIVFARVDDSDFWVCDF